jgi:Asp-tRNA(Asn)/Glu-tRNA(Gln) amidotransferase A subunit family amidase
MSEALHQLTAREASRRIRDGRLHPEDLMEASLARIAELEPRLRAFAWIDADAARQAVRTAPPGPLHGLPIGVKDILDTSDMPSGYGSPIWTGWRPRADAAAVAWTRAAGGVVLGKTVTTEFATRKPGPTRHPANGAHTPGGSSSGSAAGVAAGFFPLAFGTQTAGSVIRPAAFCGVVGYKPSFGMIPRAGTKIMSDSLDTVGVLARSVGDCALLAGTVAGCDLGDPEVSPKVAPRIGICRSPSWALGDPVAQDHFAMVGSVLSRAGAVVAERELPAEYAELTRAHPVVMNSESARSLGWELAHARDHISSELLERLEFGLRCSASERQAAYAVFGQTQQAFSGVLDGFDVLVTPSAPGEAPLGLGWTGDPAFNFIWTSLHVPCVSVPAGLGPQGLPLGIQIVGRKGDDRAVLAWAQWVAAALG